MIYRSFLDALKGGWKRAGGGLEANRRLAGSGLEASRRLAGSVLEAGWKQAGVGVPVLCTVPVEHPNYSLLCRLT